MSDPVLDRQDIIDDQASAWLVRTEGGPLDREAQREFEAWLDADPRHRNTYEDMRRTWGEIPELGDLAELVPLAAEPLPAARPTRWRSIALGGLGAVAVALIAFVALPGHFLSAGHHYQTGLAETRIVTLEDGSSVTLGARSAIQIRFAAGERRVVLAGGEAFFDVVHDANRPFLVEAGHSVVRDLGTKFDVNLGEGTVRVAVLEGLVRIDGKGKAGAPPRLVKAGERTELAGNLSPAPTARAEVTAVPALAPGAWREGRLVFDDARLADLAADVSRYYGPGVTVAPGIGNLRITAAFKTSEVPAFMTVLNDTLPVKAERASDGSFRISPAQP